VTAAGDVVAPLAAARERSRAQVAQYHQIRAVLEKLRVTATSVDRTVTVEMAAGGAIVDLRLTSQAMAKTPETLAATILEAIRAGAGRRAHHGRGGAVDRPPRRRRSHRPRTAAVPVPGHGGPAGRCRSRTGSGAQRRRRGTSPVPPGGGRELMSGNDFEVTTATLRSVAGSFGDRADTAGQIGDRAKDADVDTKAWGALGLGLGLYAGYTSARDSADRSIAEVTTFLTDAKAALESTARDYDEADRSGGQMFAAIHDGMGGAR
jgi:DNA-binding protein YbaB/uncharacterized protein YukE